MAIVVEEEKSKGSALSIVLWLAVIGVVLYGAYYLFFTHPEQIDLKLPVSVKAPTELANVKVDPNQVLGSDTFKSFHPAPMASSTATAGKQNPFLGF